MSMFWSQRQTSVHEDTWLCWSSSVQERQTGMIVQSFLNLSFHMILKSEKGARHTRQSLTREVYTSIATFKAADTVQCHEKILKLFINIVMSNAWSDRVQFWVRYLPTSCSINLVIFAQHSILQWRLAPGSWFMPNNFSFYNTN